MKFGICIKNLFYKWLDTEGVQYNTIKVQFTWKINDETESNHPFWKVLI